MTDAPATLPKSLIETLPTSVVLAKLVNEALAALTKLRLNLEVSRRRGAVSSARSFVVLHRLKDKLEELDKTFSALYEQYKKEVLPELFEDEGITSLPLAEGFRVGIRGDFRASIREGKREEAYAWLKQNGLSNLITDTVNSSSLSAAARYESEENGKDFPEALFNVAIIPTTSVTKTK